MKSGIPTPPLKPGVSTTEFWTVIICGLLLTAQAALSMTTISWAAGGVTLLSLLYVHQRGKLKSQAARQALLNERREEP
ncbi:MAG: hypothetical protein HS117_19445 [Verrucomicrobiaceae bacterium]|nr:hypothetical protein [Verrucomicrobiaceae bacterium]